MFYVNRRKRHFCSLWSKNVGFSGMATKRREMSLDVKDSIVRLIDHGLKYCEVSKILGLNESTVRKAYKRYLARKTIENQPRPGRPKIFNNRCVSALSKVVKKDRSATISEIAGEFRASTSVNVSKSTIKRKLRQLGYSKRVVAKKMGIREVNRKKRLQYCRSKRHWPVNTQWRRVIFSDEMTIIIKPNNRLKVWRKTEEKWSVMCLNFGHLGPKTSMKLMVWGCVTFDRVGPLVFVEGNMNSNKYVQVLEDHFLPFVAQHAPARRWWLQDDNASIHRSHQTETWKRQNNIPSFFWPPQSPDLNPIENIWLVLKNYVRKHLKDISTVADLRCALTTCWNNLSAVYLHSLYNSLPRRCQHVVRQKGFITKY